MEGNAKVEMMNDGGLVEGVVGRENGRPNHFSLFVSIHDKIRFGLKLIRVL